MKPRIPISEELPRRIFLIIGTAVVIVLLLRALDAALAKRKGDPAEALPASLIASDPPIAAEANVFRTHPGDLSLNAGRAGRRPAHPRTIAIYRALRAFPGAPPRIPHGLTGEEFRATSCNTCHERGGYSVRFEAYAPVTPHAEFGECLQCHASNDAVVGITLPRADPDARCRQCHTPGAARAPYGALDWPAASWPQLHQAALPGSPPPIPHDLQLRNNCLSCHLGVAAVAEIRTDHPERTNCRQCHVAPDTTAFIRASVAPERGSP